MRRSVEHVFHLTNASASTRTGRLWTANYVLHSLGLELILCLNLDLPIAGSVLFLLSWHQEKQHCIGCVRMEMQETTGPSEVLLSVLAQP